MGVYIKGMEMPKNCAECFFHKVFPATGVGINQIYCALCGINIVKLSDAQPDCPLVPVPPHGRLIDADALEVHDGWMNEDRERNVQQTHITFVYSNDIANAPTIIEADKGGDVE